MSVCQQGKYQKSNLENASSVKDLSPKEDGSTAAPPALMKAQSF